MLRLRLLMIGSAVSQLFNVITASNLRDTNPNESISGRAFRLRLRRERWINLLFRVFGQQDHCKRAYLQDLADAKEYIRKHNEHRPEV